MKIIDETCFYLKNNILELYLKLRSDDKEMLKFIKHDNCKYKF